MDVTDGVVRLAGEVERKSMLALLLPAVRAVDGVVGAQGLLSYAIDDTARPHRPDHDEIDTPSSPLAACRLI